MPSAPELPRAAEAAPMERAPESPTAGAGGPQALVFDTAAAGAPETAGSARVVGPAPAADAVAPVDQQALDDVDPKAWTAVTLDGAAPAGSYLALASSAAGAGHLRDWFGRSTAITPGLARISVRRSAQYQLQWHSTLPNLRTVNAQQIIQLVQQIARDASEEG